MQIDIHGGMPRMPIPSPVGRVPDRAMSADGPALLTIHERDIIERCILDEGGELCLSGGLRDRCGDSVLCVQPRLGPPCSQHATQQNWPAFHQGLPCLQ